MRGFFVGFIALCIAAGAWFAWRVAAGVMNNGGAVPGGAIVASPETGEAPLNRRGPGRPDAGSASGPLPDGRGSAGDAHEPTARRPLREGRQAPPDGREAERATPERPALDAAASTPDADVRWPVSDPAQREAMRLLETAGQALALDPDHPEALRDKAAALRRLDRPSEAADAMARLVHVLPDSAADRLEYGSLLAGQSRWQAAIEQFDALVELVPDDARAWHNLAAAHQAVGHLQNARHAWNRAIELSPGDADAYACRAEIAADLHDWPAAAADYEAARRLDPADVGIGVNLAWAWSRLGREEAARALLLELLDAHPSHVPIMNRLAELAWRRALAVPADSAARDEAAEWCRRSLRIDPAQPEVEALLKQATATATGEQSEPRP